uniref:Storkhead-box protein 1-like n=1 Tax=Saccoglossus kowalevskii TaxID=10224 RepID=A0ABM0GMZ6_SACKO|nr:PREDICTED: storkhead-box protein 1-like [Saccoglossus kowalevskii]
MTTMDRRLPKNIEIAPNSLSIVLKPTTVDKEKPPKTGRALFQDLQNENKLNFWNRELSESVLQLNYLGWFEPDTLFIQGGDKEMSVVREAYARRVLKPPRHHTIQILGDVEAIELTPVPQSQFVPLTEVLCLIIAELNKRKIIATVDKIKAKLADCYGDVKLPSEEILKKSLAHLIKEQKVCHTGEGYFIVTPEDFLYLRSCASSTTTSEVNVSPISQNSNQSGQSSEGQPRKTQKTVRHAVQISTEKGTHTRKKEPPSPRSKSCRLICHTGI